MHSEVDQGEHADWFRELRSSLPSTGTLGAEAARYLREHRVGIRFRRQSAGARWTVDRRIELHPRYAAESPVSPYAMSLVVHEVRHLRQGPITALSVYGELDAWHAQFNFLRDLSAPIPGSGCQRQLIERLLGMRLEWDREVLSVARFIMRQDAGRAYRVDLLPLFPIHRELAYAITRRTPAQH